MTTISLDSATMKMPNSENIAKDSSSARLLEDNRIRARSFEISAVFLLCLCFALSLFAVLHTETRSSLRGMFLKDFREVLATTSGDLAHDGGKFQVVKIKTREAISLEIYELSESGVQRMVDRVVLNDRRDAQFNFNGVRSNLVIEDFNHDGGMEIIAPTFDNDFVGHLNVFKFNAATKSFQKVSI